MKRRKWRGKPQHRVWQRTGIWRRKQLGRSILRPYYYYYDYWPSLARSSATTLSSSFLKRGAGCWRA